MKRIVKRSLAMFLAMVMLLSSTTSALATVPPTDETTNVETTENVVENEEGSEEEIKEHTDKATPDNAKDPDASDDDGSGSDEGAGNGGNDNETVYVSYELTPEDGGKISVKDEIEAGDNLTFTVTPEDGYEIASVMVDSEELEPTSKNEATGACRYAIKDVMTDTHIDVEFAEVEDEAEEMEDLEVTVSAEPENGGSVYAPEIIKAGDDLSFTVSVNEGYTIAYVEVLGSEISPYRVNHDTETYYYEIEDVKEAPEIRVEFAAAVKKLQAKKQDRATTEIISIKQYETYDLSELSDFGDVVTKPDWSKKGDIVYANYGYMDNSAYIYAYSPTKNGEIYQIIRDANAVINDRNDVTWNITVESYDPDDRTEAYFFVKYPEAAEGSFDTEDYFNAGTGTVAIANNPDERLTHTYHEVAPNTGNTIPDIDITPANQDLIAEEPEADYDDITIRPADQGKYQHDTYTYDSDGTRKAGTYTVIWDYIRAESGCDNHNDGDGHWHVDGIAELNDYDHLRLNFKYENDPEAGFDKSYGPIWIEEVEGDFSYDSSEVTKEIEAVEDLMGAVDGYEIVWYLDEDCQDKFIPSSELITDDIITLYGKYEIVDDHEDDLAIIFTIPSDFEGASFTADENLEGAVISDDGRTATYYYDLNDETFRSAPDIKTSGDKKFIEWHSDNPAYSYDEFISSIGSPSSIVGIYKNITFVAQYSDESQTKVYLTYDANGATSGSTPTRSEHLSGIQVELEGNTGDLKRNNAVWEGWSTYFFKNPLDLEETEIKSFVIETITLDKDTTVYALWSLDSDGDGTPDYKDDDSDEEFDFDVIFELGNVDGVTFKDSPQETSVTHPYDETSTEFMEAPELNITNEFLEFKGWYYTDGEDIVASYKDMVESGIVPSDWKGTSSVTFTARFTKLAKYTIEYTYDGNPGTAPDEDIVSEGKAAIGSEVTLDENTQAPQAVIYNGQRYMLDTESSLLSKEIEAENNVFTVNYLKDVNGDNIPDKDQILLIFDLTNEANESYGVKFKQEIIDAIARVSLSDNDTELTHVVEADYYPKAPANDYIIFDLAGIVITDWVDIETGLSYDPDATHLNTGDIKILIPEYDHDSDHDGTADKDEIITINFLINEEDKEKGHFVASAEEQYKIVWERKDGDNLTSPDVFDIPNDGWVFDGWEPEVPATVEYTEAESYTYIAKWTEDKNNDGVKDDAQVRVTFKLTGIDGEDHGAQFTSFDDGSVTISDDGRKAIFWYALDKGETYKPAPSMDNISVDGWTVTGWQYGGADYSDTLEGAEVTDDFAAFDNYFSAVWAKDENNDHVPDSEEREVTLRPYETSIYFGGSNDEGETTGLPNLELEVEELNRAVIESNINKVTLNGHSFSGAELGYSLSTLFKPIYVYADEATEDYVLVNNDEEGLGHEVKIVIAVKAAAMPAFEGKGNYYVEESTGLIKNRDNEDRYVTINSLSNAEINSIGINAVDDETGNDVDYFVNVESGNLTVREVTNDRDTTRELVATEAEAVAQNASDRAAAMPGEDGTVQFLTNGDEDRATADPNHVKLLVDDVKNEDNRITLLEDKAFTEAYGMTSEQAKAQGYGSQLKFLDLVDTQNGNAWVKSATGTYVYWPYPDGTDKNTEFSLVHFMGLDRETNYDGAEAVATAISGAELQDHVDLKMEKTAEGIKFFTKGDLAFSPFMLMWETDDTTTDPEQPGTDDPGTGGDTPSTGGSTPVSVSSDSSDTGYYYTVGVNGQWVHMDNVDVNQPLDEPVPAGATAVDFPEWHRWKFFKSNGIMLYNQWAHIENPFAVDDQPRSGWFYFDHDGLMRYGWYLDARSGDWYYMHSVSDGMLGTMMTGWHYDENDKRWYYLDPATGAMVTGWKQIDGKWYYFNPTPFGETWTLDHGQSVWRFNGNTVRPFGSMYQNEMTPDGYYVDENGVWVQ